MRLLPKQTCSSTCLAFRLLSLLSQTPVGLAFVWSYNSHVPRTSQPSRRNMASSTAATDTAVSKPKPTVVQYIFVRRDLQQEWPAGAVAAQVAHASVAAIAQGLAAQDPATVAYIAPANLPHMTKVVYGVDTVQELQRVKTAWNDFIAAPSTNIDTTDNDDVCRQAYWWMEQPENIPTALATWPIERTNRVSKFIKKLQVTYL